MELKSKKAKDNRIKKENTFKNHPDYNIKQTIKITTNSQQRHD